MDIVFERGTGSKPRGHALLYFRSSSDAGELWATYVVMLPITVDLSKYVPPFLMNQVGDLGGKDLSAFAFPPAPEKVAGYHYLEELAAIREDDILFAGTIDPADAASAMMAVSEAVQRYADMYFELVMTSQPTDAADVEEAVGFGVNEVLYGLMSDGDKLSELTSLVGKLKFAAEGGEGALIEEAEAEINLLAKHLPEDHQISRLVEAAKAGGSGSARLAYLFLQRCYHLNQEEFVKLGQVEEEIRGLEAEEAPG